jgi:phospholipase/carboxylesterase
MIRAPGSARLRARPHVPAEPPLAAGEHRLGLGARRDVTLFVPHGYDAARPAPLVVALHGAGGDASHRIAPLRRAAQKAGALVLAPDSAADSWDVIRGGFGPDVERIDAALAFVFARFAVDPDRIAIEGFSDGASYALSIGLANGELFRRIFAFSPGFHAAPQIAGRPRIFVSHGIYDPVLPVACSRRIAAALRGAGLEVDYREFHGLHVVPARFVREAFASLTGTDSTWLPGRSPSPSESR